ncbi:PAS domain-containing sensor histidine kinase [Lucifera butyrica]|nr:PAS domain-containing sensor histidine kinase [Lucifera butyrica]
MNNNVKRCKEVKLLDTIKDYIQRLRRTEKQLEKILVIRQNLEPDFKMQIPFSYICNRDMKIVYASTAGAKHWGYTPFEMEGKKLSDLGFSSQVAEAVTTNIKTVFDKDVSLRDKIIICRNNQDLYNYEYVLNPLHAGEGDVGAVICTIWNTMQVAIHSELIKYTRWFKEFIKYSPFGVVLIDREENILLYNELAAKLYPGSIPGPTGLSLKEIFFRLGFNAEEYYNSVFLKALRGQKIFAEHRKVLDYNLLLTCFPLKDNDGQILGAAVIFQDITEIIAYQNKIYRLDKLDLIGQLSAGIVHEIRNPLAVISGYMQFLRPKVNPGMQSQFDLILRELGRVETILNGFLSVAKDKSAEKSFCNLNNILNEIIPLLHAEAVKQSIEIQLNLEEGLPELFLSSTEIKQMVLNLARNGMDAIGGQGILAFSTRREGDEIILSIADTGCGISEHVKDKIFAPFFTTKENGTGLGLAVCASIAARHSATIEVQPAVEKGSQFIIKFKLEEEKTA